MPRKHLLERHEMNTTPKVTTSEWLDPRGGAVIEVSINNQYVALLSVGTAEGLTKKLQREVDRNKA